MVIWLLLALGASFPQPNVLKNLLGQLDIDLKVAPINLTVGPCKLKVRGYHYLVNKQWYPSVPGPTIQVWPGQSVTLRIGRKKKMGLRIQIRPIFTYMDHIWSPRKITLRMKLSHNTHLHINIALSKSIIQGFQMRTHWYHAHEHGSVTYQVGSGMSGAFIIKPRNPFWWPRNLWRVSHLVAVLQTWNFDNSASTGSGFGLDIFSEVAEKMGDQMPSHLQCEGSKNDFITVNGEYIPTLDILRDERVVFNFINTAGGYIMEIEADECDLWVLARDGVYVEEVYKTSAVVLLQGSRADVGFQCSKTGKFYIKSTPSTSRDTWLGYSNRHTEQKIIEVRVSFLKQWFPGTWAFQYPEKPAYLHDLFNARVKEHLTFEFDRVNINGLVWNETVTAVMEEGEVYAFHLESHGAFSHPYHQHINHFQVIESPILDLDMEGSFVKRGMWLDVILTMPGTEIRFLADKFAGRILIHCHLLRHSDAGMMQFLAIRD